MGEDGSKDEIIFTQNGFQQLETWVPALRCGDPVPAYEDHRMQEWKLEQKNTRIARERVPAGGDLGSRTSVRGPWVPACGDPFWTMIRRKKSMAFLMCTVLIYCIPTEKPEKNWQGALLGGCIKQPGKNPEAKVPLNKSTSTCQKHEAKQKNGDLKSD